MIVVQGRQSFTDAVGLVQGQQGTGVGDRGGIEQQGLAVEHHFAHGQAETLFDQRLEQAGVVKQIDHRAIRGLLTAQGHQRRVGQQHVTGAVQG
ncbi:hypothetical protein D3C81_1663930 [compost metagenome]